MPEENAALRKVRETGVQDYISELYVLFLCRVDLIIVSQVSSNQSQLTT